VSVESNPNSVSTPYSQLILLSYSAVGRSRIRSRNGSSRVLGRLWDAVFHPPVEFIGGSEMVGEKDARILVVEEVGFDYYYPRFSAIR